MLLWDPSLDMRCRSVGMEMDTLVHALAQGTDVQAKKK